MWPSPFENQNSKSILVYRDCIPTVINWSNFEKFCKNVLCLDIEIEHFSEDSSSGNALQIFGMYLKCSKKSLKTGFTHSPPN